MTVVGDIELDTYTGRDNKTYSNMAIVASEVFFGRKSQRNQQQQQGGQPPQQQQFQGNNDFQPQGQQQEAGVW